MTPHRFLGTAASEFRKIPVGLFLILLLLPALPLRAQELSALGGRMENGNFSQGTYSWQLDYRQGVYRNFEASLSWINEGHVPGHHRDGYAFEGWFSLPFSREDFSLSVGAAAYSFFDSQPLSSGDTLNLHGTAPIFSLSAAGYISDRWFWRITLNRINPTGDIKTNTAVAGIGYWFGKGDKTLPGRRPGLFDHPDTDRYITENEFTGFSGQSVVNIYGSKGSLAGTVEFRHGLFPHIDWTASGVYEGNPKVIRRSGFATQLCPVNTFLRDEISSGMGFGAYLYIDRKHQPNPNQRSNAAVAGLVSPTIAVHFSDHWLTRFVWNRIEQL